MRSLHILILGAASVLASTPSFAACDGENGGGALQELQDLVSAQVGECVSLSLSPQDGDYLATNSDRIQFGSISIRNDGTQFLVPLTIPESKNDTHPKQYLLRGQFEVMREVPVLRRAVAAGGRIDETDIALVNVRARRVPANAVLDPAELIGQELRWAVQPNSIVLRPQLRPSVMVARGALVTALFKVGNLSLTTQTIALDNGVSGQVIRVKNAASNRVLRAMVRDEGSVVVIGS